MDKLVHFLRTRVAGRQLHTEAFTYSLEDGALEGSYTDEISFANICRSEYGAAFDLFIVTRERIYELDETGARAGLRRDFSGVSVFRYELARRLSTGEITGSFRLVTTSNQSQAAQAVISAVHSVRLEEDALYWREEQALYRDQPSTGGLYRSIALDTDCGLYFEDSKLHCRYAASGFGVDPATFAKTPSADQLPVFLSRER